MWKRRVVGLESPSPALTYQFRVWEEQRLTHHSLTGLGALGLDMVESQNFLISFPSDNLDLVGSHFDLVGSCRN